MSKSHVFLVRYSADPSQIYFETDNPDKDSHQAEAAMALVPPHLFQQAELRVFDKGSDLFPRKVYRYYLHPKGKEQSNPTTQSENQEQQESSLKQTIKLTGELLQLSATRLGLLKQQLEHYTALAHTTKELFDIESQIHEKSISILQVNQQ
nr:MAG TPA: hypothetical protein [Caudoviricetes sp.]